VEYIFFTICGRNVSITFVMTSCECEEVDFIADDVSRHFSYNFLIKTRNTCIKCFVLKNM